MRNFYWIISLIILNIKVFAQDDKHWGAPRVIYTNSPTEHVWINFSPAPCDDNNQHPTSSVIVENNFSLPGAILYGTYWSTYCTDDKLTPHPIVLALDSPNTNKDWYPGSRIVKIDGIRIWCPTCKKDSKSDQFVDYATQRQREQAWEKAMQEQQKNEEAKKKQQQEQAAAERKRKEEEAKNKKNNYSKCDTCSSAQSDQNSNSNSGQNNSTAAPYESKAAQQRNASSGMVSQKFNNQVQSAQVSAQVASEAVTAVVGLAAALIKLNNANSIYGGKHTWEAGFYLGFDFDYFQLAAAQKNVATSTTNNVSNPTTSTISNYYKQSPGMGFTFGITMHPTISDKFSLGLDLAGTIGTTPLVFEGGGTSLDGTSSGLTENTSYLYAKFKYGITMAAGRKWVKLLVEYNHTLRHVDYTYTNFTYNYSESYDPNAIGLYNQYYSDVTSTSKVYRETRHEEIALGLRLLPYDATEYKNADYPCNIDMAFTLNRDYNFSWTTPIWNYIGINNFYYGGKFVIWVQSILKVSADVSFPANYFKSANEPVPITTNKLLPFVQLSLLYNWNHFGNK